LSGAKKRRGSPSEIDCIKGVEPVMIHLHLFDEGIQKIRDGRERGRRIEITIGAFAQAKGNMNIETRSLHYHMNQVKAKVEVKG
jgi:hypothetical protein